MTALHWAPSVAPDLAEYRLYRGADPLFVPDAGSFVVARTDTGYADAVDGAFVYKLCAVDVHGNPSTFATLLPAGTALAAARWPRCSVPSCPAAARRRP